MGDVLIAILINGAILAFLVFYIVSWLRARKRFAQPEGDRHAIAHWRYPVNEWQAFCEAEAARIRGRDLPRVMLQFAGVSVFVIALLFYLYDPEKHVMGDVRIWGGAFMGGIGVLIAGIFLWRAWWTLGRRELEYEVFVRHDGLHEVYRKHGELRSEQRIAFGADLDLASARVEKQEGFSYLALVLKGYRGAETTKRIPVPRGKESQAEHVARTLKPT